MLDKNTPMLLMEYLELGSLGDLLQNVTAPLSHDVLTNMARATAAAFLAPVNRCAFRLASAIV